MPDVNPTSVTAPVSTDTQDMVKAMMDKIPSLFPGIPNSAWIPIVLGQLRTLGALLSGAGFVWGKYISGEETTQLVWLGFGIVMLVWSGWQKVRAEIANLRSSATASVESSKRTAALTTALGQPAPVAVAPGIPTAITPDPTAAVKEGVI